MFSLHHTRISYFLLIAVLLISSLPVDAQDEGATVRLAVRPIPGATDNSPLPDPLTAQTIPATPAQADRRDLIDNLYAGLFRYDAATRQAVPVLAQEWTVSDDGLTWTFTLREDMPWVSADSATGEITALRPVVADDFVAALRRACHPLQASPTSPVMFAVAGCYPATQINPLFISDEQVNALVGIEAPDATTLVLRLAFPVAHLPALLLDPAFRPIPREFLAFTPAWPSKATSGPYTLLAHEIGASLTLVRNPFWPDPLPGNVERIELTFTADPGAAFNSGAADFARLDVGATPLRGDRVYVLGFSTERAWVNEVGVRQALSWALNREALFAADPSLVPVATFTQPGVVAGPDETSGVGYDPNAARAALAAAGYPDCAGVPEVMALAVPPEWEGIANAMVGQWESELGCAPAWFQVLTVRPEVLTNIGRDLIDEEFDDRVHLWVVDWTPTYLDAHGGAADAFHCDFGYFYSGVPCGAVDGLMEWAAVTVMDPAERADVYRRIEARLFGPAGTALAAPLAAEAVFSGSMDGLSGVAGYGPAWWGDWVVE